MLHVPQIMAPELIDGILNETVNNANNQIIMALCTKYNLNINEVCTFLDDSGINRKNNINTSTTSSVISANLISVYSAVAYNVATSSILIASIAGATASAAAITTFAIVYLFI